MNRCSKIIPSSAFIAACSGLAGASALYSAEALAERAFPRQAERAEMRFVALPDVTINGQPERLPHYVRVRGERNTILMPGIVNGRTAVVNYVRNGRGEVSDVWILSAREAALPLLSAPLAIKPLVPDPSALPSYTN